MKNILKNGQREGDVARAIESVTAKFPSDLFLWSALAVLAASTILTPLPTDRKHTGLFLGQFVAPLLILGVYNKLVKQLGHDKDSKKVQEPPVLKEKMSGYVHS